MVTELQTKLYRKAVIRLLSKYRHGIYSDSGFKNFPSNHDLAERLGLSDTAMSSISRGCASMSGITFRSLLIELSHFYSESDLLRMVDNFIED